MSDFSYFSLFTAGLACLVPLTSAYTQPVGDAPKGNPISKPGLHTIVPTGEPYTITWDPTTDGTVTLVLLKGPSTNAVPQYPIVEKTENDGSFIWTPSNDLEPSAGDTGYGIQLIVDATGQFQYTTQFGISNDNYKNASTSSSSTASVKPTTSVAPPTYGSQSTSTATTSVPTTLSSSYSAPPAVGTGASSYVYPTYNVSTVAPTGYLPTSTATASTYNSPNATATIPPQQTGAASNVAGSVLGAVLAAGVAVLAI